MSTTKLAPERSPDEVVDRFLDLLGSDSETMALVALVLPYRAVMGDPADVVRTIDKLARMYAAAKGGGDGV